MPPPSLPNARSHLTLALCTALHMFTHAYATMLVPLYLLVVADLHLAGVKSVALLVTVYGVVYMLASYVTGVLSDRHDRRVLLGIGLLGNAAAIILMGFTHSFAILLVLAVAAGIFGTIFHPAANALVPAHYPNSPGMAIGLLGAGSGLGFYLGPRYAGWRAEAAHWHLGNVSSWQRPLIELGVIGFVIGLIFLMIAREARPNVAHDTIHPPLGRVLRWRVILIAITLGCRDFAGVASISLIGIYLQKAHGMSVKQTGSILGSMMLLSIIVNPLMVYVSPGRRRLPMLVAMLAGAAVAVVTVPLVALRWTLSAAIVFQTFQLSSYAVSDAAMLERVPGNLRGRVVGLFLMIAGTFAACGPWVMGFWTDLLKGRASDPMAYLPIFAVIGTMMFVAIVSVPIIARLGIEGESEAIDPMTETMPATMEVMG